jgi:tRNA-intron endonuclease, archaea type
MQKKEPNKQLPTALMADERIVTENSEEAKRLNSISGFGALLHDGRVQLSAYEAYYLLEKQRLMIKDGRSNVLDLMKLQTKAKKMETQFWTKYVVFRDFRDRGYIIKTALKFGADFRVYDRGVKPGDDHAKWIVYPVKEGQSLTWHEFASKNRVAHSTKKRLLIGIVDSEDDITYYEIRWVRP